MESDMSESEFLQTLRRAVLPLIDQVEQQTGRRPTLLVLSKQNARDLTRSGLAPKPVVRMRAPFHSWGRLDQVELLTPR